VVAQLPPVTPGHSTIHPTMPASPAKTKLTFAEFDAYEPSLVKALAKAREFVARVIARPWDDGYCLTFCGPSGNGKTMLAKIILAELGLNAWGRW